MTHKSDLERAIARYPRKRPEVALMWFLSDRRRAGLGALKNRWEAGKNIRRSKELTLSGVRDVVLYRLLRKTPRHSTLDFQAIQYGADIDAAEMFATRVDHPECREERWVQFDLWYFDHPKDRAVVARTLRDARRQVMGIPRVSPNTNSPPSA